MANNVTIPASGTGDAVPVVEAYDTTGSNGPKRQAVTLASIGPPASVTALTAGQKTKANSIPVVLASDQDNAGFTPAASGISVVTTGGTAVTPITGPCNGGIITNPINTAAQAVTAEPLYVDMVGTPSAVDANANGTTFRLDPGQSFDIPALAAGVNVKVNAATAGHKFSAMKW